MADDVLDDVQGRISGRAKPQQVAVAGKVARARPM